MKLFHYYDKNEKPFQTLSDLSKEEAEKRQNQLKVKGNNYDRRDYDGRYLLNRRIVEDRVKKAFCEKGGRTERDNPIYFIMSESHEENDPIYCEWFNNPAYVEIDCSNIDMNTVSFSYGDSFVVNHPEYHDQDRYAERVFTYQEILEEIAVRGWPHELVKPTDPFYTPRYIEAQVWCLLDEI